MRIFVIVITGQKIGSVCVLLAISVASTKAAGGRKGDNRMKEAAMALVNDCKQKTGASDADVNSIREKKLPTSHEGLCLLECLFSSARIMSNGKFNKQGTINIVSPLMKGDGSKIKKLKDMADMCDKEINGKGDSDACNVAKQIVECTSKNGKAFGFQFPTHL